MQTDSILEALDIDAGQISGDCCCWRWRQDQPDFSADGRTGC